METAELLRFGPFEREPRAGVLRRLGVRIRLPEPSFQILILLLERSGELVTREDVRLRLWPNETVVDFAKSKTVTSFDVAAQVSGLIETAVQAI